MTKGTPRFTASTNVRPSETIVCGILRPRLASTSDALMPPELSLRFATSCTLSLPYPSFSAISMNTRTFLRLVISSVMSEHHVGDVEHRDDLLLERGPRVDDDVVVSLAQELADVL